MLSCWLSLQWCNVADREYQHLPPSFHTRVEHWYELHRHCHLGHPDEKVFNLDRMSTFFTGLE